MNPTRTLLLAVTAAVAAILVLTAGLTLAVGGGAAACTAPLHRTPADPATSPPPAAITDLGFDQEQQSNAATIVSTAAALGVPVRGWIVAVAVAIQESSLRNLDHGDAAGPDSRGLFQQRDDWGTRTARLDPAQATRMFLTGGAHGQNGLLDIRGWQTMPLTDAAQAVQISDHPDAYGEHEPEAARLVAATRGGFSCDEPAGTTASQAVAFARQQIGTPYRWGGDGPAEGGFDCSGLTHAAYAAAGIRVPRTAQTQHDADPRLPADAELRPGDLLFFGSGPDDVRHVGIYAGNNQMINAPRAGTTVRVEDYRWRNYLGATRPAN